MKSHLLSSALLASCVALSVRAQTGPPVLPGPSGRFKTGRVSFYWEDSTREELETRATGDKRELMVHVFYPRDPGARGARAVYLPDINALRGEWSDTTLARIAPLRSSSYEGAPTAPGVERYPVAIFLPGGGMKALMYQALTEDLASHGWVVAAIDLPFNAPIGFPDGRVVRLLGATERTWIDAPGMPGVPGAKPKREQERERMTHWARDVSFVIDRLTALDAANGQFARRLDLRRGVGVFGHSLGGLAAGTTRLLDTRVHAAVNLDGWGYDGAFAEIRGAEMGAAPFLWILRKTEKAYPDRRELQPIAGGAMRVSLNLPQFTHGDFSDYGYWNSTSSAAGASVKLQGLAETRAWIRIFFNATIRGDSDGLRRMIGRVPSATPTRVTIASALWPPK